MFLDRLAASLTVPNSSNGESVLLFRWAGLAVGRWLRWCLIPAMLAMSLAAFGWWTQFTIERTLKQNLGLQLKSILAADQAALRVWLAGRRANAESIAADGSIHLLALLRFALVFSSFLSGNRRYPTSAMSQLGIRVGNISRFGVSHGFFKYNSLLTPCG